MTREEVLQEVLKINAHNIILELPTGLGKTKLSIEKLKQLEAHKILIVVNRIVHKTAWEEELKKWWPDCKEIIIMTTYASLEKHTGEYDVIIWDEAQHFTTRCAEMLNCLKAETNIFLSATLTLAKKDLIRSVFKSVFCYRKTLRGVIEADILPDPEVFLMPLDLKNDKPTEYYKTGTKSPVMHVLYKDRYSIPLTRKAVVKCTEQQYYNELDRKISWWKEKYMSCRNEVYKFKWLHLCSERLKWLSNKKVPYTQKILEVLDGCRTITFCNNIEQTEILGKYCINSKNKDSLIYLENFNKGDINHITCCNMLNESVNLVNCKIGIFNNLNSSNIIVQQRNGRLLRHKEPMIVIPYFRNTREETLVEQMKENYNPFLIKTVHNYRDILK